MTINFWIEVALISGPAGSWTRTGLVINDADYFDGHWYASGSGPGAGPTVSFVPNTVGTTTTVTATASEALGKLFLRVRVMQLP